MKGGINIVELAAICYAGVAALREATGGGVINRSGWI